MNKKMILLPLLIICITTQKNLYAELPNYAVKIEDHTKIIPPAQKENTRLNLTKRFLRRLLPVSPKTQNTIKNLTIYVPDEVINTPETRGIVKEVHRKHAPKDTLKAFLKKTVILSKEWKEDFDIFNEHKANNTKPRFYWEGTGSFTNSQLDYEWRNFTIYYPHPHADKTCYARQRIAHSIGATVEDLPTNLQAAHTTFNQFE